MKVKIKKTHKDAVIDSVDIVGKKLNHICPNCHKEIYIKPSRLKRTNLVFCNMKCRTEYYNKHKECFPRYKERTEIEKFFDEKFTRWKMGARKRNIYFDTDLSPNILKQLWNKQEGRCFYSQVPMSIDKNDKLNLVSVDRIDSNIGYTESNIVLCSYAFNSFKFTYSKDEIIKFISSIRQSIEVKVKSNILSKNLFGISKLNLISPYNIIIKAGERTLIQTGTYIEIPNGYFGMYCGGVENAIKEGISVQNNIIDSNYMGEIEVIAYNYTKLKI